MKDKRIKSKWRKRLAWVAGLSLLAAIIIVGLLTASEYPFFKKKKNLFDAIGNTNGV